MTISRTPSMTYNSTLILFIHSPFLLCSFCYNILLPNCFSFASNGLLVLMPSPTILGLNFLLILGLSSFFAFLDSVSLSFKSSLFRQYFLIYFFYFYFHTHLLFYFCLFILLYTYVFLSLGLPLFSQFFICPSHIIFYRVFIFPFVFF